MGADEVQGQYSKKELKAQQVDLENLELRESLKEAAQRYLDLELDNIGLKGHIEFKESEAEENSPTNAKLSGNLIFYTAAFTCLYRAVRLAPDEVDECLGYIRDDLSEDVIAFYQSQDNTEGFWDSDAGKALFAGILQASDELKTGWR